MVSSMVISILVNLVIFINDVYITYYWSYMIYLKTKQFSDLIYLLNNFSEIGIIDN